MVVMCGDIWREKLPVFPHSERQDEREMKEGGSSFKTGYLIYMQMTKERNMGRPIC